MKELPAGPYLSVIMFFTEEGTVLCNTQIGVSWLKLHFPKGPFERLGLHEGDKFYWAPSQDGNFSEENMPRIVYEKLLI